AGAEEVAGGPRACATAGGQANRSPPGEHPSPCLFTSAGEITLELLDLRLPDDSRGIRPEAQLAVELEHRGVGVGVAGAHPPDLPVLAQHLVEHRGLEAAPQAAITILGEDVAEPEETLKSEHHA